MPSSAANVAAVPYDVVSTAEARALAAAEPLSFLHVSRPEIGLPDEANPYTDAVYARAVTNLTTLIARAPLVAEETESLYLYRLCMGSHVQSGVAACFSVDEYEKGRILKHERTRPDKEDDRTRHIVELRAQTGPVFPTYRAEPEITRLTRAAQATVSLIDFDAADGVRHTIWRVPSSSTEALVAAFDRVRALYIADGHHRAAAAARARRQLRAERGAGEWDRFLAVAFPHDELQVLPYNRVVHDLGSHSPESLLAALRERHRVEAGAAAPARRGLVSMYLDGRWYAVDLGEADGSASPDERLDVSRLQHQVLEPLLGIDDPRTSRRIDFVGGIRGTAPLETLVRSGVAAVAFSMYPVSVDDIMTISDRGGIMPPKSSWFEPKLRDGLLVHTI
jgi:uncharacterized protein (DUF1015 family)